MKKNMLLVASLFTACVQGMETNFWTITFVGTKINLNKGFISDAGDKVDAIVVGINQQLNSHFYNVGELFEKPRFVYEESRDTDDASDDSYQPYPYYLVDKVRSYKSLKKGVACRVFFMTEPCIRRDEFFGYSVDRPHPWQKNLWFGGNKAIEEATKDLAFCYKEAFDGVLKRLTDKVGRSIAFATLSADVGFPREKAVPIAVRTLLECIKNNPGAYDRIELFVNKRFEFAWYKLLLMEDCGLIEKICLLYCANKDPEHLISMWPREIIYYIAKLV